MGLTAETGRLPDPPRFDPRYRVRIVESEYLFFIADEGSEVVRGEVFARLAPWIDGKRTIAEVLEGSSAGLSALEVEAGLLTLARRGLLAESRPPASTTPPAPTPPAAPGAGAVVLHPTLSQSSPALGEALAAAGLDVRTAGGLLLAPIDDFLAPELAAVNREALSAARPWLPIKVSGEHIWLGPLLAPGRGCWECLATDLRRNRPVVALLTSLDPAGESLHWRRGEAAPADGRTARLAAARIAAWLRGEEPTLESHLLTIDPTTGAVQRHAFRPRSTCPACGGVAPARPSVGSGRLFTVGTGLRVAAPERTLERLRPLVSPLTGWIRSVRPRPGDGPPWVFVAEHPSPTGWRGWAELRRRSRVASAGKGTTREQAEVSALAEAVERVSGTFWGDERVHRATLAELGEAALAPNRCLLYSSQQLAGEATPSHGGGASGAPRPLDPEEPIDWTPLTCLGEGADRLLPTSLCYHGHGATTGGWRCRADSNGCAAGNCREEAVLQGLLELVERDAVAIWWRNRIPRPRLDAHQVAPWIDDVAQRHREIGRRLDLFDLTHDLGIPVAAAVSRTPEGPALLGFGAHLFAGIAAARAVSEVHQFLPRPGATSAGRAGEPRDLSWLDAVAEPGPLPADAAVADRSDLEELIDGCVRRLAAAGLETFVLDQTRDGLELAVVRVVVPGLRPWWPRLAPGRLYQVPVALGWLERPRKEAELNLEPLAT